MPSTIQASPDPGLARGRRIPRGARAGTSFVELLVVMVIMIVAVTMFASTVTNNVRQRAHNREMVIASEAARAVVEELRGVSFAELYARYNENKDDDPESGTSPGPWFSVAGLSALAGAHEGCQGMIHLPEYESAEGAYQLREDLADEDLGMPRDLSGDNLIDGADHAADYSILPVRVRVEWDGYGGERHFEIVTLLTEFS